MKKVTQVVFFILLIAVSSTLTFRVSAVELSTKMPGVYVEPQSAFAAVGTTFNVSVKIFNLTRTFYGTDYEWKSGNALPPPGSRFNYSLGNLYGFNISFSWNPDALKYVDHTVHTPVQDYPDGVLNGPIWNVKEDINSTEGTYSIAQNSRPFLPPFNCPNNSATVFTITFTVEEERSSLLSLENVELTPDPVLVVEGVSNVIPHKSVDGVFTPVEMTRITSIDIGVDIGSHLYDPSILGENATVYIHVGNNGIATNPYNLTLYKQSTPLKTWKGESLAQDEKKTYNHTLNTKELGIGIYTLTAMATIRYNKTTVVDTFNGNFSIINAPILSISFPNTIYENDTATLSAVGSFNQNSNSQIINYRWILYEPRAIIPVYEYEGINVTHRFTEKGTWRTILVVTDNWGITYRPNRNATLSYLKEVPIEVQPGTKPPPPSDDFPYEFIAILIISLILITIMSILVYITRKERS